VPKGKLDPEGGVQVGAPTPGQLSVAVAVYVVVAEQFASAVRVLLAGQVTTGFWLSVTVTVNEQLPSLPAASVALHVTVVVPTGNEEPDAGSHVTAPTPGQLSVAVAVYVALAAQSPLGATRFMFAGQVTTGSCSSTTVTVNVQLPGLPTASVVLQVTVVVPIGNEDPDGGVQVGEFTPGQLSVAVAVKVTSAAHSP
jgi:hypothetical protein